MLRVRVGRGTITAMVLWVVLFTVVSTTFVLRHREDRHRLPAAAAHNFGDLFALDGVRGFAFGSLLNEDTVYAPGYSDSAFRQIAVGMPRSRIDALLGAPQKEWPVDEHTDHPGVGARWSYSPGDTHFRCRVLLFRNGVVVEKHTEFYVD